MAKRLGVVGFGTMGSEIALLGACGGLEVTAVDSFPEALDKGLKRLPRLLKVLSRDERFFAAAEVADDDARRRVMGRITTDGELSALAEADYVIEAAPENAELKQGLLSCVEEHCRPDTLLATNTSSISITALAAALKHPERLVGMHFFNPPSSMLLVEVIPGLETAEETTAAALELAKTLGRTAIRVKETPGFVVNRVLMAMMNEAMAVLDEGVASMEDIDTALKLGAGFPLGAFKLADLVGLDVLEHATDMVYRELGHDKFRPPHILRQHVRAGRLGRKTRHGFYKY